MRWSWNSANGGQYSSWPASVMVRSTNGGVIGRKSVIFTSSGTLMYLGVSPPRSTLSEVAMTSTPRPVQVGVDVPGRQAQRLAGGERDRLSSSEIKDTRDRPDRFCQPRRPPRGRCPRFRPVRPPARGPCRWPARWNGPRRRARADEGAAQGRFLVGGAPAAATRRPGGPGSAPASASFGRQAGQQPARVARGAETAQRLESLSARRSSPACGCHPCSCAAGR